jgi:hypothetical protein
MFLADELQQLAPVSVPTFLASIPPAPTAPTIAHPVVLEAGDLVGG